MKLVSTCDYDGFIRGKVVEVTQNGPDLITPDGVTITRIEAYLYFNEVPDKPDLRGLIKAVEALTKGTAQVSSEDLLGLLDRFTPAPSNL